MKEKHKEAISTPWRFFPSSSMLHDAVFCKWAKTICLNYCWEVIVRVPGDW